MKKKITTLLVALGCIPLAAQAQTEHGVKGGKWMMDWLHFKVMNLPFLCLQALSAKGFKII